MLWSEVTFPFLSDIVFVRTWYPVSIPTFYNPVTSLLKPAGEKDSWSGMKTTGQLRHERGIKLKQNKDSLYKVYLIYLFFFVKPVITVKFALCLRLLQTESSVNTCWYICMCDFVFLSTRHNLSWHDTGIKQWKADYSGSMRVYKVICMGEVFQKLTDTSVIVK